MELEIKTKRENPLLSRTEVEFVLHHPGETTPTREQVREMVASKLGGDKKNVIVDHLRSVYGKASTGGLAKLYESQAAAKKVEAPHMLERNGITTEEAA